MSQLRALVGLRWRMVRSRRARRGLLGLVAVLLLLLVEAAVGGQLVPEGDDRFDVLLLAPTAYLLFAALALVAPLATGGGNELFPEGELVAFPVTSRTIFYGGLLMAPLNLAWAVQLVGLTGVTAVVAARGAGVTAALLTLGCYIAFVTTAGHALAWGVIGLRSSRAGRTAVRTAAAAVLVSVVAVITTGSSGALLDRAPTTRVVVAAVQGSQGRIGPWFQATALLVLGTVLAARCGRAACAWALRRTPANSAPELAVVTRRRGAASPLGHLVAIDRASVWRSTPLRRGVLVLAVLPGSVALLAHPTWTSLSMLPGLVAAGAGLLFGVNAFCLDGAGAAWVATLPHPARTILVSKLLVTGQTCVAAVGLALLVAGTQLRSLPTAAEVVAVGGSALSAVVLVVALCAKLSVTRPHKADLRGPRDTPAPPATMAVYSLRLALATTWPGMVFAGAAALGSVAMAAGLTLAVATLAGRSVLGTLRKWDDPVRRARVVTTVSYG